MLSSTSFLGGVGLIALRSKSLGRSTFEGWLGAGVAGALTAPIALLSAKAVAAMALAGVIDSIFVAKSILKDERTSSEQYFYAAAYVALSLLAFKTVATAVDVNAVTFSVENGIVSRRGMRWRTFDDGNGGSVDVYGQGHDSSSTTPGHGDTIEALAILLAATGRYTTITMQQSWRTISDRVIPSRKMPGLLLHRHDGKFDAIEIYSLTDEHMAVDTRVLNVLKIIPPEMRGNYKGIDATTDITTLVDPFL